MSPCSMHSLVAIKVRPHFVTTCTFRRDQSLSAATSTSNSSFSCPCLDSSTSAPRLIHSQFLTPSVFHRTEDKAAIDNYTFEPSFHGTVNVLSLTHPWPQKRIVFNIALHNAFENFRNRSESYTENVHARRQRNIQKDLEKIEARRPQHFEKVVSLETSRLCQMCSYSRLEAAIYSKDYQNDLSSATSRYPKGFL